MLPKHHGRQQQQSLGKQPTTPLLLLKPNGAPVFTSFKSKEQIVSDANQQASTLDQTNESFEQKHQNQATVRAHSFVIGRKVENSTSINLLSAESGPQIGEERHFPVKVIFVKPTIAVREVSKEKHITAPRPQAKNRADSNELKTIKLKKSSSLKPKPEPSVEKQKPSIQVRPKSVVASQHDQSAKTLKLKKPLETKIEPEVPPPSSSIPFAENRLKGQFSNMTKHLFKKASDALQDKKVQEQRKQEELVLKKEKQRLMEEQIKKVNQEIVQKQKEKGAEHIDFRKKEVEAKEQARKDENKAEREKQKELRQKRKDDGRRQLGLELIDDDAIEEHRRKLKEQAEAVGIEAKPIVSKGITIAPPPQQRPKSSNQQKGVPLERQVGKMNDDIKSFLPNDMDDQQRLLLEQEAKRQRENLLKEQKRRRREKKLEEQLKADQERQRKEDNLRQLNEQFARQKVENLLRIQMQQKIKEEMELQKQREREERQYQSRYKRGNEAASHKEQITELHDWIEQQMNKVDSRSPPKKEQDDEQILNEPPRITQVKIDKKVKQPIEQEVQKTRPASAGAAMVTKKAKNSQSKAYQDPRNYSGDQDSEVVNLNYGSGNFEIPGNSELHYVDTVKYGQRDNRYGVYGDNGYSELVDIRRRPPAIIEIQSISKKQESPNSKEIKLSRDGVISAFQKIQEYHEQKQNNSSSFNDQLALTTASRSAGGHERRILNEIHKQYLLNFDQGPQQQQSVPGVVNIKSEIERQKQSELKLQTSAVLIIQKWTRGFLARHLTRKLRNRRQREIEAEYGYFEDQVKFSKDYNLKKFIREKQVLREKNQTRSVIESDSIVERIGDSSSTNARLPTNMKSASLDHKNKENVMVQNFFGGKVPEKDPNSIISIMIKRNMPKVAAVQSPVKLDRSVKPQKEQKVTKHKNRESPQSEIEEEIISVHLFERDDDVSQKSAASIEEDIEIVSKGGVSSDSTSKEQIRPFQSLRNHQPFAYKQMQSSESIQEDLMFSVDRRSPVKRGAGSGSYDRMDSGSIAEESQLLQASRASSGKQKNSGTIDESIHESVISGENSNSSSAIAPPRRAVSPFLNERQKTIEQVKEFEVKLQADKEKREGLVSDLLGELNRYESASMSALVVERMEKIINKSMAQKDQLFIAQRMHQLEQEKKHKEEIARIREEQVKLMAQLMLAGGFGHGGQQMQEGDRKELMDSLQKIMEKPIIIQSSAPQKKAAKSSIKDSGSIRESIQLDGIQESNKDDIDDIEEEIVADGGSSEISEEIKESMHPEESFQPKKRTVEQPKNQGSYKQQSKGGIFDKNSFHEFTDGKFKEYLQDGGQSILHQLERQIQAFKVQEERNLKEDLQKSLITPRTHHRKGEELEKWAYGKKLEIMKDPHNNHQVKDILNGLKKDKEIILEKIGGSSSHEQLHRIQESSSIDYEEIEEDHSNESDNTKNARDQILKLANREFGDNEISESYKHDQKIKKKKAIAKRLLQEKEKIIQEGLKEKKQKLESNQAEQMINLALKLDPQREIEKRLKDMKRAVEESSENLDSMRSMSVSQSGVPSESVGKKKVQFASPSPDKFRSSAGGSNRDDSSSMSNKYSNQKLEDSIGESISIQDSFNPSLSGPHHSSAPSAINDKKQLQSQSIIESKDESQHSSSHAYEEDFEEQSHAVSADKNLSTPVRRPQSNQSDSVKEEEDYSQNFDESIGQSIGQQQSKGDKSMSKSQQPIIEVIVEEQEKSGLELDIEGTLSYQATSNKQGDSDPLQMSSDDHEVVVSSKSIEWEIIIENQQKDHSSYSENFASEEMSLESSKKKDITQSLDSVPSDPEYDDIGKEADKMTEEFMEILLNDIRDSQDLVIGYLNDENEFKEKFPFNLDKDSDPEPMPIAQPVQPKVVIEQIKSNDEVAREKYQTDLKKLQERFTQNIQYLDLIINHISREDLITSLERPIETDPLKKLAYIFSQEQDDSQLNDDTLNASTLLSLEYFFEIEEEYKRKYQYEAMMNATLDYVEQSKLEQWHHKAIFDAFNQALDMERPYKDKGRPAPWSKQTRVVKKVITSSMVDQMVARAKERVHAWCKTEAGTRLVPPPPQNANPDENNYNQRPLNQQSEDDRINALREDRLLQLLARDQDENESKWVDYEDYDTQVKFDLADMILEVLAGELAGFIHTKK